MLYFLFSHNGSKLGASLIKTGRFFKKGYSIPVAGNATLKASATNLWWATVIAALFDT